MVELNQEYHTFSKIVGEELRISHASSSVENNPEQNIKAFQINQRKMGWIVHDNA